MSYVIYLSNGNILTTIPDGTINTTSTSIGLPGRLYPGYGQVVDTDLVHILENSANSSPPANALMGQLWFNTTNQTLNIAPTANPANANSWITLAVVGANSTFGNITVTGNTTTSNANIGNTLTANYVDVNYDLDVSGNAVIDGNLSAGGNLLAANIFTNLISTGSQTLAGNAIGTWTITGGLNGTSLNIANGNLVISNTVGTGIKANLYMYANGEVINFNGTYTNSNVAEYLPVYTGQIGLPAGGVQLYGNLLSTGSLTGNGIIVGNWTIAPGSQITGLSNISGSSIVGDVPSANIANYAVNVLGNNQPNINLLGTLVGLTSTGVITAPSFAGGRFFGDGGGLSNISGSVINGQVQYAAISNSVTGSNVTGQVSSALIAGTVYSPAQPNVTSLGTLTRLNVNGNIVATNVTANTGLFTGDGGGLSNISAANIVGVVTISGAATTAVTVTASAQPNITSVGTLTSLSVTGTVSASTFTGTYNGSGSQLTNINAANIVGTVSNAAYAANAGYADNSGSAINAVTVTNGDQPNITSVGTLNSLNVNGSLVAKSFTANTGAFSGNASGLNNIPGGNVIGQVPNASVSGTVYSSAQPNITSLGTLNSLNVSGDITGSSLTGTFYGNGYNINVLNGANVLGTVANATNSAVANFAGTAGYVTQAAQANITTLGVLTGLTVSGTGNVTGTFTVGGNTVFSSGTQRTRDIVEKVNIIPSAISSGTVNVNLIGPAINYYTVSTEAAGWVFNFQGNSTVSTNSYLNVGESVTTTILVTQDNDNDNEYATGYQIDGVTVTPIWQGNVLPSTATDNCTVSSYTFTIVKTASATYTVFASISTYG